MRQGGSRDAGPFTVSDLSQIDSSENCVFLSTRAYRSLDRCLSLTTKSDLDRHCARNIIDVLGEP